MPSLTSPTTATPFTTSFSPGPAPTPGPNPNTLPLTSSNPNSIPPILPLPTASSIQAALPPATTFDFIPQIHALLSRLLLSNSNNGGGGGDKDALQTKDLANEIAGLRRQILAAKGVVSALQDGGKTVEELEREMSRVEGRVGRLREGIKALGEDCARQSDGMQSTV